VQVQRRCILSTAPSPSGNGSADSESEHEMKAKVKQRRPGEETEGILVVAVQHSKSWIGEVRLFLLPLAVSSLSDSPSHHGRLRYASMTVDPINQAPTECSRRYHYHLLCSVGTGPGVHSSRFVCMHFSLEEPSPLRFLTQHKPVKV
jgi:hypothetical protein